MNISGTYQANSIRSGSGRSAAEGIRAQEARLERNVVEVADSQSEDSGRQNRALVEQKEIVHAVRADARSLEAASQRIGTFIDIRV